LRGRTREPGSFPESPSSFTRQLTEAGVVEDSRLFFRVRFVTMSTITTGSMPDGTAEQTRQQPEQQLLLLLSLFENVNTLNM
jgi:hypothetical protein